MTGEMLDTPILSDRGSGGNARRRMRSQAPLGYYWTCIPSRRRRRCQGLRYDDSDWSCYPSTVAISLLVAVCGLLAVGLWVLRLGLEVVR